jgi:aromatic ring-opening dioxygenase catalytic subunit (LigB family)
MATVVAGMGSSHAFAFMDPRRWDERRQVTRSRYAKKYGVEPPEHPRVFEETAEQACDRFQNTIGRGLERLKASLPEHRPTALIVIGDDQDENYREDNLPQFSVYLGDRLTAVDRERGVTHEYACASKLAQDLFTCCVESGVDMASSAHFPEDRLISHAHAQVLTFLESQVPVIPVFVNAIHVPAPPPARCYEVGQVLRKAIEALPAGERVVVYASGGLSHFTAGYPWAHYQGPESVGSICEDFDLRLVDSMRQGRGSDLAKLSSKDLIDYGEIELRQWIVLQGVLGDQPPEWLEYQAMFRGLIGMAVGYWPC